MKSGGHPTNDKERKRKNDARDARKIAKELRNGNLQGIYVPDPDILQDRMLLRTRQKIALGYQALQMSQQVTVEFPCYGDPAGTGQTVLVQKLQIMAAHGIARKFRKLPDKPTGGKPGGNRKAKEKDRKTDRAAGQGKIQGR